MAPWSFETSIEYHVAAAAAPSLMPKTKRAGVDIPSLSGGTAYLGPGSPLPSPVSTSPQSAVLTSPGRKLKASSLLSSGNVRISAPSPTAAAEQALRHSRSLGKLASQRAPAAVSGPERLLHTRWQAGRVSLILYGEGGREGGELRILREGNRRLVFSHAIPAVGEPTWGISDVQHVHMSVAARSYALSLRLADAKLLDEAQPPPKAQIEVSDTWADSGTTAPSSFLGGTGSSMLTRKPSRQPSETTLFGFSILPGRLRSKTISSSSKDHSPAPSQSELPPAKEDRDTYLYLSFSSKDERDEWYAALRAIAHLPLESTTRPHRRLKVTVLDIQESQVQPQLGADLAEDEEASSQQEGSVTSGSMARSKSPKKAARKCETALSDMSTPEVKRSAVKPGWSKREKLRLELLLDDRLLAQTGWAKATDANSTPFWGEDFSFIEVPPFSSCTLLLLRHRGSKTPVLIGKVDLALVSTFAKVDSERYPVRSMNGSVMGEIRLSVTYHRIDVISMSEYNALIAHSDHGSKFLYVMSGRGLMEGTMEHLCRIGLCEGVLMPRVLGTATIEARSAGTTLFRNTTPLSKTLEVLMRVMCGDFLETSLRPTITKVINEKVGGKVILQYGDVQTVDGRVLGIVTEIIKECWRNMYNNRHLFPNFIRHILAHLFRTVKEYHTDEEGDDLLRYKAISSFVFLRLVGPALLAPHLFGLANSLPPAAQQETLKLVAKVLHSMAFFSEKDSSRSRDVALFQTMIKDNIYTMTDFIVFISTPSGPYAESISTTSLARFLAERRDVLPPFAAEAITHLTPAGPVDIGADWAVMCETWYERRLRPGVKLSIAISVAENTEDIQDLVDRYGPFLDRVHALSVPQEDESAESVFTCSRPSLNLSLSTTPSSDDSHHVYLARKMGGFAPPPDIPRKPQLCIDTSPSMVEDDEYHESPPTARPPRPATPPPPEFRRGSRQSDRFSLDPASPPLPTSPVLPLSPGRKGTLAARRNSSPTLGPPRHGSLDQSPRRPSPLATHAEATEFPWNGGNTSPTSDKDRKSHPRPSKSGSKSSRRKRRPTIPQLLLGRSAEPAPPMPPVQHREA